MTMLHQPRVSPSVRTVATQVGSQRQPMERGERRFAPGAAGPRGWGWVSLVVSVWLTIPGLGAETPQQAANAPQPAGGPAERRIEQARKLRWGMFVCWSFSTFSGKEWTPGVTNLALFKPSGCDVRQW